MITLEMLISTEYAKLADLPFEKRHSEQNREKWGAWRWLGIMDNKDAILRIILRPGRRIWDIGGAKGPLGFGSEIVDIAKIDIWGRPVAYRDITEISSMADVIFSSHMLEHVENPWMEVEAWRKKLVIGGYLILYVPGTMGYQHWHPKHKPAHKWLFMTDAALPHDLIMDWRIAPLTDMYGKGKNNSILEDFDIIKNVHVQDSSILVLARKQ